jgi:hypothetical protein
VLGRGGGGGGNGSAAAQQEGFRPISCYSYEISASLAGPHAMMHDAQAPPMAGTVVKQRPQRSAASEETAPRRRHSS